MVSTRWIMHLYILTANVFYCVSTYSIQSDQVDELAFVDYSCFRLMPSSADKNIESFVSEDLFVVRHYSLLLFRLPVISLIWQCYQHTDTEEAWLSQFHFSSKLGGNACVRLSISIVFTSKGLQITLHEAVKMPQKAADNGLKTHHRFM